MRKWEIVYTGRKSGKCACICNKFNIVINEFSLGTYVNYFIIKIVFFIYKSIIKTKIRCQGSRVWMLARVKNFVVDFSFVITLLQLKWIYFCVMTSWIRLWDPSGLHTIINSRCKCSRVCEVITRHAFNKNFELNWIMTTLLNLIVTTLYIR